MYLTLLKFKINYTRFVGWYLFILCSLIRLQYNFTRYASVFITVVNMVTLGN